MKIYNIFTGGTIGSRLKGNGYIGPEDASCYRLIRLYQNQYADKIGNVEFEVYEPYRILSENLESEYLIKLFLTIRQVLERGDADGIVVTHGTDTLQYGAAMLGYIFGDAKIPIVLVSSNYVLEDERANGLINYHYALEFIKGQYGTGVFVSYCNIGSIPTIHRATRLQPLIPYSDWVGSVEDAWYGKFENMHFVTNPEYHVQEGLASLPCASDNVTLTKDASQILWIHPHVGMHYPILNDKIKVVLHSSYHSGTICVNDEFENFIKEAKEQQIPVYLTGYLTGRDAYESVLGYQSMGVKVLHTSSEVALFCKLWLALSNGLDWEELLQQSVAEDWI